MGVIYCYTNLVNNKKYIGQTINDPRVRYNQHKSSAFNENANDYDSVIHRAFRKYGLKNFKYEIIAQAQTPEELNDLEIYYIQHWNTQIPNGYNVESGGKNASKPAKTLEEKEKLQWTQAKLTKEEVEELRIAYTKKLSPTKIYKEKYQDRLHFNSFLNIWTGQRYKHVMPEVFTEKHRHTKLTAEIVKQIRADREQLHLTYKQLADKYNSTASTVADIIRRRTWKNV